MWVCSADRQCTSPRASVTRCSESRSSCPSAQRTIAVVSDSWWPLDFRGALGLDGHLDFLADNEALMQWLLEHDDTYDALRSRMAVSERKRESMDGLANVCSRGTHTHHRRDAAATNGCVGWMIVAAFITHCVSRLPDRRLRLPAAGSSRAPAAGCGSPWTKSPGGWPRPCVPRRNSEVSPTGQANHPGWYVELRSRGNTAAFFRFETAHS